MDQKHDNDGKPLQSVHSSSASIYGAANTALARSTSSVMSSSPSALLLKLSSSRQTSASGRSTALGAVGLHSKSPVKAKLNAACRNESKKPDFSAVAKSGPPSTALQMIRRAGNQAANVKIRDYTVDDCNKLLRAQRMIALARQAKEERQRPALNQISLSPMSSPLIAIAEEGSAFGAARAKVNVGGSGGNASGSARVEMLKSSSLSKSHTKSLFLRSFSWSENSGSLSSSINLRVGGDRKSKRTSYGDAAHEQTANGNEFYTEDENDDGYSTTTSDDDLDATRSYSTKSTVFDQSAKASGEKDMIPSKVLAGKGNRTPLKSLSESPGSALNSAADAMGPPLLDKVDLTSVPGLKTTRTTCQVDECSETLHMKKPLRSAAATSADDSQRGQTVDGQANRRGLGGAQTRSPSSSTRDAGLATLAAGKGRRARYTNVVRILPFLSPYPLSYKSHHYRLEVGRRVSFRHRSRLRTRDIHEKFLNGNVNISQKENGELALNPGPSLQLIKQHVCGTLASVLKPRYFQRFDLGRLAILRTTNATAYSRYVKGMRHAASLTAKKDELERLRTVMLARLSELTRLRTFSDALSQELAQNKSEFKRLQCAKMGHVSQLMGEVEAHNSDVQSAYFSKMDVIKRAELEYHTVLENCNRQEAEVAAIKEGLVTRYKALGNEIKSLNTFKAEFERNCLLVQQSLKDLKQKKETLANSHKDQIQRLYQRHELERSAIEAKLGIKIESLLKENIESSADIIDNVVIKLKQLNCQLNTKISQCANDEIRNADKISTLEAERVELSLYLKTPKDPRRAVLKTSRTFSYS